MRPADKELTKKKLTVREYERLLSVAVTPEHKLFVLNSYLTGNSINPDIFAYAIRIVKTNTSFCEPYSQNSFSQNDRINITIVAVNRTPGILPGLLILEKLVESPNYEFQIFKKFIGDFDLLNLIILFRSENEIIRSKAYAIIESIYCEFEETADIIREIVENEFTDFLTKNRCALGMDHLMRLSHGFLKNNDIKATDVFFQSYILPCWFSREFGSKNLSFLILIEFCRDNKLCIVITANYICKIFPNAEYQTRIDILALMKKMIGLSVENRIDIVKQVCFLCNMAFRSEDFVSIQEALLLFSNHEQKYFSENIKKILPEIFNSVYSCSKRLWHNEKRCQALKFLYNTYFINIKLFVECLKNYKRKILGETKCSEFECAGIDLKDSEVNKEEKNTVESFEQKKKRRIIKNYFSKSFRILNQNSVELLSIADINEILDSKIILLLKKAENIDFSGENKSTQSEILFYEEYFGLI